MKITGKSRHCLLHILVDSGSTQNLLDISTAKKLKCEISKIPPFTGGSRKWAQLNCRAMSKVFTWSLVAEECTADVFLIGILR